MKPYIFDIQKYCIHDGDGIRTTVFFKGCPLKCTWCHNPESQRYTRELLYYGEKCTGCRACAEACPRQAIGMKEEKMVTDRQKCDVCEACMDECLKNAREASGKEYTIPELMKEVEKDKMFYEESFGGITLSGGEVMTQDIDYIETFVKKLYRKGYDIAIDTCGYAPYENFERILPYVSTFLYDIKLMDSEKHKKYTAFGNELILDNLKRLSEAGARLYIRVPIIEGVNADEDNINELIEFMKEHLQVARIHLLPYHNTGVHKYEKLSRVYEQEQMLVPAPEKMEKFADMIKKQGFHNVKIGG